MRSRLTKSIVFGIILSILLILYILLFFVIDIPIEYGGEDFRLLVLMIIALVVGLTFYSFFK